MKNIPIIRVLPIFVFNGLLLLLGFNLIYGFYSDSLNKTLITGLIFIFIMFLIKRFVIKNK